MRTIDTVNSTIFLAIELSASSWLVAARVPGSDKPHLHRIDGGNTVGLLALISSLRDRVARRLNVAIGVVCCFEAGRDGFWLHRLLTVHGLANYVLDPTSILINRRARQAKTDRLDAVGMVRVLGLSSGGIARPGAGARRAACCLRNAGLVNTGSVPASCAGDKIRDGHQSQNCQNAGAHNSVGRAQSPTR